ncbi:hypothetical protein AC578_413 [Pseudocercospora eumusae]|uniref:F-box domain-containing protein n=1 Tax=Pseudocercospora eumusae TaxID=321146 RepID=A0A139HYD3_9PEZI|nr:hypothetical protein AC578_413 [Pseudocercospora eumusae]
MLEGPYHSITAVDRDIYPKWGQKVVERLSLIDLAGRGARSRARSPVPPPRLATPASCISHITFQKSPTETVLLACCSCIRYSFASMDRLEHSTNSLSLRSSPSPTSTNAHRRERRFSDVARDSASAAAVFRIPNQVGSRCLPKPDEQQHKRFSPFPWSEKEEPSLPVEPHTCQLSACSLAQVFSTPELLGMILSYLGTTDVITLRRTSRTWSRTVQESPSLRLHLFSRPQWDRPASDFQLLDLKLPGLHIEKGEPVDKGRWIHVSMNAIAARSILPAGRPSRRPRARSIFEGMRGGLGSRTMREGWPSQSPKDPLSPVLQYEDLYITQPPVLGMQAFLIEPEIAPEETSESSDEDDIPCACAKLSCDAGITLDFLADTTLSLLKDRRDMKDTEGRSVMFKAIVSFCKPTNSFCKRGTARSVIRIG